MVLTSGTKLGPYEILSPLGAGGMGEVYRARDKRLDRDVALKILRSEIAGDADRRARFEREAKTVAALSHPNIVALFEVGNAEGLEYTVSELVDGEPLRAQLQHGAIPVRQVVELATQFADGMAAAHATGIVHRDLKPENVMVTRDGRVKILDFGLARVFPALLSGSGSRAGTGPGAETIAAPAVGPGSAATEHMTSPGMVLGTAAYMSPEQARGMEATYRSDQFAFGLIVYEMLAGKQAFAQGSAVETMAAIVRDEPEPLEGRIPAPLRWLVDRCLEKDPMRRFDSSRDLYQQLRTLRDHFSEAFTSSTHPVSPEVAAAAQAGVRRQGIGLGTVAALVVLAAVLAAGGAWWLHPSAVPLASYKYTPFAVNAHSPLWSPDGKMAVYSGDVGSNQDLFLRRLDSPTPRQLTNAPETARALAWSPDSSHIFNLQITPGDLPNEVRSVGSVGGEPDLLWTLPSLALPVVAVSPDGKAGVVLAQDTDKTWDVFISDPIGSPMRRYPASQASAHSIFNNPQLQFSPDGKQLLFIRAGDSGAEESWLLPWPAGSGTPRRVLDNLPHDAGTPRFTWMPDNRRIVAATASGIGAGTHLYLADTRSNRLAQITQGTGNEGAPSISPDGVSLLFADSRIDYDILSLSLADGTTQGLIVTPRSESMPAWAARADALVYVSDRLGEMDIRLHAGNVPDRPLVTRADFKQDPPKIIWAPVLSPDGTRVIFVADDAAGDNWLWEASVAGGAPVRLVDASDSSKQQWTGDWSPDGKQFAFGATEPDGKSDLKIVRTSGGAVAQKLLEGLLSIPTWSPDGRWIAYEGFNYVWHLASPDGKQHRDLGAIRTPNLGFSRDGKTAYGIRYDADKPTLFSLDIETAKLRDIKPLDRSLRASSPMSPSTRFTLAPDGKSFAYSIAKPESSVWMLQGFAGK
jgi:serine/threonine protein kinase/Tol biopolymer transport system component